MNCFQKWWDKSKWKNAPNARLYRELAEEARRVTIKEIMEGVKLSRKLIEERGKQ